VKKTGITIGYNFYTDRFEIEARTPLGYEAISTAEMEFPRGTLIPLQVDFVGNRILFTANNRLLFDIDDKKISSGRVGIATSALGGGYVALEKFRVVSVDTGKLPARQLQDILSFKRGAAVIYRSSPPIGDSFDELIDHSLSKKDDMRYSYDLGLDEVEFPEEAVFSFPQGRFVEIHRIGFKLYNECFPKEVKFQTSNLTPKSGFKPLTKITLKPEANSYQEFSIPPTTAKYLKIQVTKVYGTDISIPEMFVEGYLREIGIKPGGADTLGEIQIREKEPNNITADAQTLPLDTFLGGKAAQQDTDCYLISIKGNQEKLVLHINNVGIIRPDFTLLTKEGNKVKPVDIETVRGITTAEYKIQPGDYHLVIVRPETWLTIVYDDSGSMGESVPIVKKILKGYLENLGTGLNIKLMKYAGEPVDLSDFTHDPATLKEAIEKEVGGGGGTDTYKGLMAAIESVRGKHGNRAVLAILDEIAGEDDALKQYIELWDSILDAGISFSTIGVQDGWDERSEYFGNSYQRIFGEIAYATGGQFFHSPSYEMVKQSANTIFEQLTAPVKYRIKAETPKIPEIPKIPKQPGFVQVLFEEGVAKIAAKNVELILDASYSMWEKIGKKNKITIARGVLTKIIRELPESIHVGLRVFGHRYTARDKRANQDSELMFPIGPVNKAKLIGAIKKIKPRGKTPLVYSILQSPKDFEGIGKGAVIVVTDGKETCGGDINSVGPILKKSGLDLTVNIVGFDIKGADALEQLEAIAKSTGGRYLDAKNSRELLSSLRETLQVEFAILDEKGVEKARGLVGGKEIEILEGTYTLRLMLEPDILETKIEVGPKEKSTFLLTKENDKWSVKESD